MHLSSREIAERVFDNAETVEKFERWEKTLGESHPMVYRDEWTAKKEGPSCITCGRERRAAELHPEMVGYSQWRADRALWSAAEPVPLAGHESEYEEFYPR